MKKLRGLSLFLCVAMILSVFNFAVLADEDAETKEITAYITISVHGDIVTDTEGNYVAEAPVTLTGKESYTLDDLFYEAHELYYNGGAEVGYAKSGSWLTKAWGIENDGYFSFYINLGDISPWDLTATVEDGYYIDLCVLTEDCEFYSHFDVAKKTVAKNYATNLTLYESYYGPGWTVLYRECEGATILVNGEETELVTNANGECTLTFDEYGEYIISAKKTEIAEDWETEEEYEKLLITAPICVVRVAPVAVDCKYLVNIAVDEDIDIENAKMIVAGYRNGMLIDTDMDIEWNGSHTASVYLNKEATDIKLFLWNSLEEQEPLIKTEVILNLK